MQSLISDLAAEDPKHIRQDVALIALNHALEEREKSLIVEIAQQIVQESEYQKVAGTVAYRILEQRAPEVAQNIRNRALLLAASPTVTAELRSNANPAALTGPPVPSPSPEVVVPEKQLIAKVLTNLIFVQFRNEQSQPLLDELRQALNKNGLNAPGVDRVDANFTSSIRYFHEEDRALAERVLDETKKFFQSKQMSVIRPGLSCFPEIGDRYKGTDKTPSELWQGYQIAQFVGTTVVRAFTDRDVRKTLRIG